MKQTGRNRVLSYRLKHATLGQLLAERQILTTQDFVLIGDSLDALRGRNDALQDSINLLFEWAQLVRFR